MNDITNDIIVMLREGDLDDDLTTIENAVRARKMSQQFGSRFAFGKTIKLNHLVRPKYLVGVEGKIKKVNAKTVTMDFPDNPTLKAWSGQKDVKIPKSFIDITD